LEDSLTFWVVLVDLVTVVIDSETFDVVIDSVIFGVVVADSVAVVIDIVTCCVVDDSVTCGAVTDSATRGVVVDSVTVEVFVVNIVALSWKSSMAKFISKLSSPGDDRRYWKRMVLYQCSYIRHSSLIINQ